MNQVINNILAACIIKSSTVLIAILLLQNCLSAQVVRGGILDINTGEPLNDVDVIIVDTNDAVKFYQTTDSLGDFLFDSLNAGKFNIKASRHGYVSLITGSYNLSKHDTLSMIIRIEAEPVMKVMKNENPPNFTDTIKTPNFSIAAEMNKSSSENENNPATNRMNSQKQDDYISSSGPFLPRQIIEVVPKKIEGAKGIIILSLKIDHEGFVKEHKIIKYESNKNGCLENVIQAVYKSRWQPIIIDEKKTGYWIEKTYEFK